MLSLFASVPRGGRRSRLARFTVLLAALALLLCVVLPSPTVADGDDEISREDYVAMDLDVSKALAFHTQYPVLEPSVAHSRFAYVMIHYEGTPKDDLYVLGSRVVIKSIRDSGTKQDIVVLCATNVRESTKQAFREVGAIIREVPNIPNPYKATQQARRTYKSRFEFTFNKLYIWNLVEYERVMYLDADNLIVRNVDELFLCGHYCNTFMNPLFFHTGLMVVKPDAALFHSLLDSLLSLKIFSYDGADQGFLTAAFPGLDAAPLFNATAMLLSGGAPSEAPLMRYPMEYNFNSVFWYPFFSYDYFRRAQHPFSNDDDGLPIGTIAYCIGPLFKPWNWFPHIFFHTVRAWNAVRVTLPDSYAPFVVSTVLLQVAIAALALVASASLGKLRSIDALRTRARALAIAAGVPLCARVAALASFFAAVYCAATQVPQEIPPVYAWPAVAGYLVLVPYAALSLFAVVLAPPKEAPFAQGLPAADAALAAPLPAPAMATAAALGNAELPPLGASVEQALAVVMRLDFFTVKLGQGLLRGGAGAGSSSSGAGAGSAFSGMGGFSPLAANDDTDLDLDMPLASPHGGGGGGHVAVGIRGGGSAMGDDGDGDLEDPDWTDSGAGAGGVSAAGAPVAMVPLGANGKPLPGSAGKGGKSAAAAAAAGHGGSVAATAAAQLRSGVTLALMLPLVLSLFAGFYFLMVAEFHFFFVEKICFLLLFIMSMVWSTIHIFRCVADVAFLVPGTVGPIYL